MINNIKNIFKVNNNRDKIQENQLKHCIHMIHLNKLL